MAMFESYWKQVIFTINFSLIFFYKLAKALIYCPQTSFLPLRIQTELGYRAKILPIHYLSYLRIFSRILSLNYF